MFGEIVSEQGLERSVVARVNGRQAEEPSTKKHWRQIDQRDRFLLDLLRERERERKKEEERKQGRRRRRRKGEEKKEKEMGSKGRERKRESYYEPRLRARNCGISTVCAVGIGGVCFVKLK